MTTPSNSFGGPGGAYGNDPNPSGQGNDPYDREIGRRAQRESAGDRVNRPGPAPFPFMFGIPPKDLIPNYMPQISPMTPGTPMNVEQLYSMYGATPNAPMPVTPNVPAPAEQPPAGNNPPDFSRLPFLDLPLELILSRFAR